MSIKGLSEKRHLPRLGKIHLGVKKTKMVNGREVEFPSAVDYFVCPLEVQKLFGEKPKELRILIPVEEEERWCSQYYRCYSQSRGLICKGDGENCIRTVDVKTGALASHESKETVMKEMSCAARDCPEYERQCREIMNLQFMLPEVPGLGIWQIDTSSINSIKNINSAADLIKRIYGRVSMVPLLLTLEPQEVQTQEGKKRTVNILNLRTNQTLLQMMETVSKPTPEMLGIGVEMPEPDDEVPVMIIPQVQEEKVTAEPPKTEPPKAETTKPATKATRKAPAKDLPQTTIVGKETTPVEVQKQPASGDAAKTELAATMADPESTTEEKRVSVEKLRTLKKTGDEIRQIFYSITGKKGHWLRSDLAKIDAEITKLSKGAGSEAEDFLAEFEKH